MRQTRSRREAHDSSNQWFGSRDGSSCGGLASLTSTWIGERSRHRRDLVQREITRRETAYSDFIEQASKLYVASAMNKVNQDEVDIESTVSLYAVESRIRLFASEEVMEEAEKILDVIMVQYGSDNLSIEQLRERGLEKKDPLKPFSVVCRRELKKIQNK